MGKLKGFLGHIWALFAFFIALATFVGFDTLPRVLVASTGLTVSPRFTGGEIVRTVDHGGYKTHIHRPVFDGLIGERQEGFIQLNWEPSAGLPLVIQEEIDYDGDHREDFLVTLDTKTGNASITAFDASARSIDRSYRVKKGWAVRVLLQKRS
jgi:hypothetical protein